MMGHATLALFMLLSNKAPHDADVAARVSSATALAEKGARGAGCLSVAVW